MRILLFPTWYPTKKNPILGSFFREQALVLREVGFEYMVIKPNVSYLGFRGIVKFLLKFIKGPLNLLDDSFLEQNPSAYTFDIPQNAYLGKYINNKILDYIFKIVLLELSSKWSPDIIHGISYPEGAIYAHKCSDLLKKPFVLVEHNIFLLHYLNEVTRNKVLSAYSHANNVGVVSEYQKRVLLTIQPYCQPKTLWNLIDESKFELKENKSNIFTIITVTYPAPIKDYTTFLDSLMELTKYDIEFRFIMIGSDTWDDLKNATSNTFTKYAEELNIRHLGEFIPFVSRQQMNEILVKSSVFVVTSIAETYGIAAREAMMCGIPVVTTACGGVEDAINPATGLVAQIRNAKDVASCIYSVYKSVVIYDSGEIRSYAINNFGKNVFTNNIKKFYLDAISQANL